MKKKINTIVGSIGAFVRFHHLYPTDYCKFKWYKGATSTATYSSCFMFDLGYLWLD